MIDVHFNLSLMIIYVGLLGQDVDLDHFPNPWWMTAVITSNYHRRHNGRAGTERLFTTAWMAGELINTDIHSFLTTGLSGRWFTTINEWTDVFLICVKWSFLSVLLNAAVR